MGKVELSNLEEREAETLTVRIVGKELKPEHEHQLMHELDYLNEAKKQFKETLEEVAEVTGMPASAIRKYITAKVKGELDKVTLEASLLTRLCTQEK